MTTKNARKTLIGSFIGMMALTAASAATAGVAWFTTTRTANVTFPNASVSSNRGDLLVGKLGAAPTVKEYAVSDGTDYDGEMDSISSVDGVNFYNALLDVDGSELGKFYKVDDPDFAQFGFSAGVQTGANTDLNIYLEDMKTIVTDAKKEQFHGDGTKTEFTLAEKPNLDERNAFVVKVGGEEKTLGTDYTVDADTKKVTFTAAPIVDDEETAQVDESLIEISYRYEVADNDPVKNSIRVALFASNSASTLEAVAVAANETLVWDMTHANAEVHQGIAVTEEDAEHENELHTVRKASERFIDLDYAVEDLSAITAITLTHGTDDPIDLSSKVSVSGRRVTITDDTVTLVRGDVIKVTYTADTIGEKTLANVPDKIDGYYAGADLCDENGGTPNEDGDLEAYGAYLGETNAGAYLNIVVRAWIEGTDEDHNLKGEDYPTDSKDSIDISEHDYKVAMDLKLAAIDSNLA